MYDMASSTEGIISVLAYFSMIKLMHSATVIPGQHST